VRGPVGSLARPDISAEFEAFDAGDGVTVHVHRALLADAQGPAVAFQFGLLGRCTALIQPPER
jgi:hypothetical protein